MKSFAILACSMMLLSFVPHAVGFPPQQLSVSLVGFDKAWFAVRFNVTPGNDLMFRTSYTGCSPPEYTESLDHSFITVYDGRILTDGPHTDGTSSFPGVQAGISPIVVGGAMNAVSPVLSFGNCGSIWGGGGMGASHRAAEVVVQNAPIAWYNVTAWWTTGVTSWDVQTGHSEVKTYAEFQDGVSASAWAWQWGAGVAAAVHETTHTTHDVVGYFWQGTALNQLAHIPRNATGSCTQNGQPCPNVDYETNSLIWIKSSGPTDWSFDAIASVFGPPRPILAMAELPDDHWLTID